MSNSHNDQRIFDFRIKLRKLLDDCYYSIIPNEKLIKSIEIYEFINENIINLFVNTEMFNTNPGKTLLKTILNKIDDLKKDIEEKKKDLNTENIVKFYNTVEQTNYLYTKVSVPVETTTLEAYIIKNEEIIKQHEQQHIKYFSYFKRENKNENKKETKKQNKKNSNNCINEVLPSRYPKRNIPKVNYREL